MIGEGLGLFWVFLARFLSWGWQAGAMGLVRVSGRNWRRWAIGVGLEGCSVFATTGGWGGSRGLRY